MRCCSFKIQNSENGTCSNRDPCWLLYFPKYVGMCDINLECAMTRVWQMSNVLNSSRTFLHRMCHDQSLANVKCPEQQQDIFTGVCGEGYWISYQ